MGRVEENQQDTVHDGALRDIAESTESKAGVGAPSQRITHGCIDKARTAAGQTPRPCSLLSTAIHVVLEISTKSFISDPCSHSSQVWPVLFPSHPKPTCHGCHGVQVFTACTRHLSDPLLSAQILEVASKAAPSWQFWHSQQASMKACEGMAM